MGAPVFGTGVGRPGTSGRIGSDDWAGFRIWVVALPFFGAALLDFGPLAHRRARTRMQTMLPRMV